MTLVSCIILRMKAEDFTCNPPSRAAGVVLGRNSNGRETWENSDETSLKEIQDPIVHRGDVIVRNRPYVI